MQHATAFNSMHKDAHFNDLVALHDSTSVSSLIADIKMIILHMHSNIFITS